MPKYILFKFFGFKHLIKDAAIKHAASSSGMLCHASDSLMMSFQKGTFPDTDYLNFSSEVAIDKGTVVMGNGKASSRLKDRS